MLADIKTDLVMDKKAYKETISGLEKKMTALQETIKNLQIPVIITFEGWGASGKGTHIGRVVYPLDPRFFNVYTMDKVNEDILMRPFLWPYWTRTPAAGHISIFDKSWHRIVLPNNVDKWRLKSDEMSAFYYDVNAFERKLVDDGTLIIKLFLHISREEQHRRFKSLTNNPDTAWRVEAKDWDQNKKYSQYMQYFDQMIEKTDNADARWHIIESNDKRYAITKIYTTIINAIEQAVEHRKQHTPEPPSAAPPYTGPRFLRTIPMDCVAPDDQYKEKLSEYQRQIDILGHKLYIKRRPVIIAYEGWDAAGKGGSIKRLTEELDPRCYEVVPVGAPTAEELAHHYLWRFYKKMPKDGHFTIFDRTWYGRVLVERVEQLTPVSVWQRAYREINDMEAHLYHHGAIIFKFWLHIDKDEQLRRFNARQNDPLKQYKITAEDWRNREKWDLYEDAAEEMLAMTNTTYAPWTIVESNSKKFARLKVLETLTESLEKALR